MTDPTDVPALIDATYRAEYRRVFATLVRVLRDFDLAEYHLAHAARADLLRRLGRTGDARSAYARALDLARQEPERRFLRKRLDQL